MNSLYASPQTKVIDKEQILSELTKLLTYCMGGITRCPPVVLLEHNLALDCGLDSLDGMELIMEVEEAFDIEINDDEAEALITVETLVDLIVNKLTS